MTIQSYNDCRKIWENSRKRKMANHTYLIKEGENFAIRLHDTNVITYHPDGSIVLTTGGWKTPTTRDRINTFTPVYIQQRGGIWTLGNGATFADGLTIGPRGKITGAGNSKKEAILRNRVSKYALGFTLALINREVPKPGPGDCWACSMVDKNGKSVMDSHHIISHFDKSYFVPSLVWNAVDGTGSAWVQWVAHRMRMKTPDGGPVPDSFISGKWATQKIVQAIRKHCHHFLGLA